MFITFEGIEGSGKTTQVELLTGSLEAKGYECIATREPGATRIGRGIRDILLDSAHSNMLPLTELLLYEADRAQHVHDVIKPALAASKVVISDRFFDATTVYQGYARGCDLDLIERIHQGVLSGLRPDLTLILDLPVEMGLERAWQRIHSRTGNLPEDRFEKEALEFHEKVRLGYLTLAKNEPDRFRVIDASADPQTAHKDVLKAILQHNSREGK